MLAGQFDGQAIWLRGDLGAARVIEVVAHEAAHHAHRGATEAEADLYGRVALARAVQAEQQRTRTTPTSAQRF